MTISAKRIRAWNGPAILTFGFRPFFLAGAIWAALAMVLWVAMLAGRDVLPTAFDPVSWHAHEMLFGYLGAVMAGFLLTAVPNWTGSLPISGWPLLGLALLWGLGRVAVAVSALLPWLVVALADLALPLALAVFLAREIVAGRNWRNLPVLVLLVGRIAANAAFNLEAAQGDAIVMMDADLQHSPNLIPTFLQHWRQGNDVVYALRKDRQDESPFKRLGTRLFYKLVNMAGRFEVPAGAGDFRLMDRAVVNALLSLPERNRFMKGLYAWVGFEAVAVPYMPEGRLHGKTTFNPWSLIRLSVDGLTGFTTWPLRAVSFMGFVLACFALLYGAYLTAVYLLYGHVISGWTTIAVGLMGFSGIQLLSLGVVGEYVGRIFEEVKARPVYIVKRALGQGLRKAD